MIKKRYTAWTIANNLSTLTHGWLLFLTLPINAIASGTVHTSKDIEFSYTHKEIPIDELNKFARYTKKLPRGITLENLEDILP